jgi:hypothetical protein
MYSQARLIEAKLRRRSESGVHIPSRPVLTPSNGWGVLRTEGKMLHPPRVG